MAVTIDPRPTVFGDRMIVTGTFGTESGDNAIDLSAFFSSIDFAGANYSGILAAQQISDTGNTGPNPPPNLQEVVYHPQVRIDGTTVRIASGQADSTIADTGTLEAGTFIAIGRRA